MPKSKLDIEKNKATQLKKKLKDLGESDCESDCEENEEDDKDNIVSYNESKTNNSDDIECSKPLIKYNDDASIDFGDFAVYFDIETFMNMITKDVVEKSKVTKLAEHIPYQIAYALVCRTCPDLSQQVKIFNGEDCIDRFIEEMLQIAERYKLLYIETIPFSEYKKYSEIYKKELDKSQLTCRFCNQKIEKLSENSSEKPFDIDHCHLSGKVRGPAHPHCNRGAGRNQRMPVINIYAHNSKKYDMHFIIKNIKNPLLKTKLIASNTEQYTAFEIVGNTNRMGLKFLDTFSFLPSSIDKLTENLQDKEIQDVGRFHKFSYTTEYFKKKYPLVEESVLLKDFVVKVFFLTVLQQNLKTSRRLVKS
eukprot:Pompholyxophrys_punicea_v1_NODE_608_length_1601_cov_4.930834.p1 type:complete len:363 gc:universal NODE_608_length_1601_cov_4.930834:1599-511(-)